MRLICKNLIFVLIGIATPYSIFDWQWWLWTFALIAAVEMHKSVIEA